MARIKRMERVVALTKELVDNPYVLFPFAKFCQKFGVAKSTLSEDVQAIRGGLSAYDLGIIETVSGASGGVRFIPYHSTEDDSTFLQQLAAQLAEPERILPGGLLYMNDLLFTPSVIMRLGEIVMQRCQALAPEYIMTVETKGIPLALCVARAFNIPLVMARRTARFTEGPAVSINYVSGSTKKIQSMFLPKRALPAGGKVLIIDDFMKAGGTAKGLQELAQEVGAEVVGTGCLVATEQPQLKMVAEYFSLLVLDEVDESKKISRVTPVLI